MGSIGKLFKYVTTALYVPYRLIYKAILAAKPVDRDQIFFSSFPDYSDNAKALYRYMLSNPAYERFHFVWLVEKTGKGLPNAERTRFVRFGSPRHFGVSLGALKAIAGSRYLFYTHSSPILQIGEKKGQTVVNLWHGCGYKDRKTPIPEKKQFDFGLVPGPVFVEIKSRFWGCEKDQVLPIGYPRYDQMKNVSEETKAFYSRLKGSFDRVILWMPTYRKTERNEFAVSKMQGYFELPVVDSEDQLRQLNEGCRKNNILLCVKRHPKQIRYACEQIGLSNIVFLSNQDLDEKNVDLYGLFACADALVTDYSSSAIDYLLTDKPMAFTLNDMEDYGKTQGFVFPDPLKYMPGDHLYRLDDFLKFLEEIRAGEDPHKKERDQIMRETHNPCANYCERICARFINAD